MAKAKAKAGRSVHQSLPLLGRLFRNYILPQRLRVIGALVLAVVIAVSTAGLAKVAEPMMNVVVQQERYDLLPFVSAGILALFVVRALVIYLQRILVATVNITMIARLQIDLHSRIIDKDLQLLRGNTSGQLLSRIVNDVNQIRGSTTKFLITTTRQLFTVIALIGVMFHQDWVLALIALILLPTAGWGIGELGTRMRKIGAKRQKRMGRFTDILSQQIQGFKQIKVDAQEDASLRAAAARRDELVTTQLRAARVRALVQPVVEVITGILVAGILFYGGLQVAADARSLGSLVSFLTAFAMVSGPIRQLGKVHVLLQNGLAAAERVFEIMDRPSRVVEAADAQPLPTVHGEIALAEVGFSYDGVNAALSGVNLYAEPGDKVALVGPSGAGKSTIINLLPRLYDPETGAVRIDGVDIRTVTLDSLRRQIALVSQDVFLFTDTVARNIAFARDDVDRAAVEEAARAANAHDFIMALPEGYDTQVGEHGTRLSGGQRQRIAIARALLKDAPILLLDEATSALDSESELAVQDALNRLMAGRTALVIAHRLSTVANADRIYVMDKGAVVETGTHDELIAANGLYARMASLQFQEPEPTSEDAERRQRESSAEAESAEVDEAEF